MHRKASIFCTVLSLLLSGCGSSAIAPGSEMEHIRSLAGTEDYDIPDEAVQRLQSALEAEPITVPKDEWTMDTIRQAVRINGKNLTVPCTINDLGEGFAILEDETHKLSFNEEYHTAIGVLTYYGKPVAAFQAEECESADAVPDAPLETLLFITKPADGDRHDIIYPISVNGVTLCSSAAMVKERLYFMDATEDKYYYRKQIDDFCVSCDMSETEDEVMQLSVFFNLS